MGAGERQGAGRGGDGLITITPSVLLVHGAFTETTTWSGVVADLRRRGIDAVAVPTPLTGLRADAAYVASRASGVDGPVLVAGEGYGGAVISAAAPAAPNVVGLVFVAALVPDEGESCVELVRAAGDTRGIDALLPAVVRLADGTAAVEASIRRDAYRDVVAGDLSADEALTAAATQRTVLAGALDEPSPAVGWRALPSWFVIATRDRLVSPAAQRTMALRAGSLTVEVDASHAVCRSRPAEVAEVIATAARAAA